ncbi:MAG: hypothetical protein WCC36_05810 [Gammaproteobacteria bacterium]
MKRFAAALALSIPLLLQGCNKGGSNGDDAPPPAEPNSAPQSSSPQSVPEAPQNGAPEQDQAPAGGNTTQ